MLTSPRPARPLVVDAGGGTDRTLALGAGATAARESSTDERYFVASQWHLLRTDLHLFGIDELGRDIPCGRCAQATWTAGVRLVKRDRSGRRT